MPNQEHGDDRCRHEGRGRHQRAHREPRQPADTVARRATIAPHRAEADQKPGEDEHWRSGVDALRRKMPAGEPHQDGCCDQARDEGEPSGKFPVFVRRQQPRRDAADAGDAPLQRHQQYRRQADQRAAGGRSNRGEGSRGHFGPPAREIDAADLSAIGDKVNGGLTLPRNFETEASGFLQPFPVLSPPSARGRRTPVQRRPPVAHGDLADVAELADTVLVHRASQRDAAATHAASNPLAPLATVNPDAWRALAERAVEPNGYYLPDWALALDASARDRTDSSTICA